MDRARILVLDPDAPTLANLRVALASSCELETSPSAAVDADVIVLPIDSSGFSTMAALKDERPGAAFVMTYGPGQEGETGRALREGAFYCLPRPTDPQVARAVIARCLEVSALWRTAREHAKRLADELAEARALQRAMLPPADGRLGKAGVSVAVRTRPCAEVGGDVVDYAESGATAALLVADVAGHGIGAAMLTTVIKSAFAASAGSAYAPADLVRSIYRALAAFSPERFVTCIVARIDRGKRTVEYVNAGHPAGWIFQRKQIVGELSPTAPLIMPGTPAGEVKSHCVPLPENAGLLLYTDGLIDARGDVERYGVARLRDDLSRFPGGGAALLDGILASVDAFTARTPQPDDITLLAASVGLSGLA